MKPSSQYNRQLVFWISIYWACVVISTCASEREICESPEKIGQDLTSFSIKSVWFSLQQVYVHVSVRTHSHQLLLIPKQMLERLESRSSWPIMQHHLVIKACIFQLRFYYYILYWMFIAIYLKAQATSFRFTTS